MNKQPLEEMICYLGFSTLMDNGELIQKAEEQKMSYTQFLKMIIKNEYDAKREKTRINRLKKAKIPNDYVIETFPFDQQPHLNQKRIMERYDSLDYIHEHRNIILIGVTGSGKTGLASSILRRAIDQGHSGLFINFNQLMEELLESIGTNSSKKTILKYTRYQCLLIDDLSFVEVGKAEVGLFCTLINKRHQKNCTIITTTYGLDDWNKIFDNKYMTDSLIGRLTDGGHVMNLKNCKSIRKAPDID